MFVRFLTVALVVLVAWAVLARASEGAGPEQSYVVRPERYPAVAVIRGAAVSGRWYAQGISWSMRLIGWPAAILVSVSAR